MFTSGLTQAAEKDYLRRGDIGKRTLVKMFLNCCCLWYEVSNISAFSRRGSTVNSAISPPLSYCSQTWQPSLALPVTRQSLWLIIYGISMSPLDAWEWRLSKSHPALLSTFSLLSSRSPDPELLRRSPGSRCVGIWKLVKELPSDGLFSENESNKTDNWNQT